MTQELITYEHSDFMPALSVPQATQRFNTLVEFVKDVMREGVDYGKVPGTEKNTLMKAGAEKLTTLFGMTVRFQVVEQVQDWSGDSHGGEPFFYYWYRCLLFRGDLLIAEADGSCNSRETKYRWRESKRKCPSCGAAAINKSKFAPRNAPKGTLPGFYCFAKMGGCGQEFAADDLLIVGQSTGRAPNPDICDLVNTIQKMSQKRAMVAATLIGCNASEFFTQDVEDIGLAGDGATYIPSAASVNTTTGEIVDPATNGRRTARDHVEMAHGSVASGGSGDPRENYPHASDKQRGFIAGLMDRMSWSSEQLAAYAIEQGYDLVTLTTSQASMFIDSLKTLADERTDTKAKIPDRPLVKRLRDLIADCRGAGVPIPSLPKPSEMTDAQLIQEIDALEIEYDKAQKSAASALDEPNEDPLL